MFCRDCGSRLNDNDLFCGNCGAPRVQTQRPVVQQNTSSESSNDKILYGVVGFFAPIVGLILSFCTKKDKPEAAKVGIIVSVIRIILNIIYFVFYFLITIVNYV